MTKLSSTPSPGFNQAQQIKVDDTAPLLIFGGAYSNFQATQALYEEAARLRIPSQNIICTGDVVAYCAAPSETVSLIRQWGIHTVQGNCEYALGNDSGSCGCGFETDSACDVASKQWFDYSRKHLDDDARRWMRDLPCTIRLTYNKRTFTCIHGGDSNQSAFIFASTDKPLKQRIFERLNTDIIIGGHCGLPFGEHMYKRHYWLNAGVIGMPANDGNAHTWYMIINNVSDALIASWHPLHYDHLAAQSSMSEHTPTSPYTQSLSSGLWPNMDILPKAEAQQQGQPLNLPSLTLL